MSSARARGILLLIVVFVVGGAAGYGLARTTGRSAPPGNPMEPHAFVQRLNRELKLDSAQRDSIVSILTRHQTAIDSAWRALRPEVRATIDSAQMEIVNVLHPDQRGRYLELVRAAHGGMGSR
ncbi:MAG: hypothetical protein ACREOJ_15570 [Gemmatimonadaceae bacterium]